MDDHFWMKEDCRHNRGNVEPKLVGLASHTSCCPKQFSVLKVLGLRTGWQFAALKFCRITHGSEDDSM